MHGEQKPETDNEIDEQLNRADGMVEKGGTKYRGMTYEQGVAEGIRWLTTNGHDKPCSDEDYT